MFELKTLSADSLLSYLREEIDRDTIANFLNRWLTENNFEDFCHFFEDLAPTVEAGTSLTEVQKKEVELYGLMKIFLIYEEVLSPKNAKDISNEDLLRVTFAELHFFNNTETLKLPVKEYARDYMTWMYHSDITKNGYKDQDNIESELTYTPETQWDTGRYLVRYLKGTEDETRDVSALCETDSGGMALANARLNADSPHFNYLSGLRTGIYSKDIFWFDGSKKTVTFSPVLLNTYFKLNQVKTGDSLVFKKLATFISSKTIHYKV